MDCVAPLRRGGDAILEGWRRNPSVSSSRFLVAKGYFRPACIRIGEKARIPFFSPTFDRSSSFSFNSWVTYDVDVIVGAAAEAGKHSVE